MPAVARNGDPGVGVCTHPEHVVPIPMTGTIIATASKTTVDGIPVARLGDIVIGGCGHTGVMVSSSGTATVEGIPVVRMGDSFAGIFSGIISAGSGTTQVA